jgi:hypothetical protein
MSSRIFAVAFLAFALPSLSQGYIYESGLHVPLVVRVPENFRHLVDSPNGSRLDGFVGCSYNMMFMPLGICIHSAKRVSRMRSNGRQST